MRRLILFVFLFLVSLSGCEKGYDPMKLVGPLDSNGSAQSRLKLAFVPEKGPSTYDGDYIWSFQLILSLEGPVPVNLTGALAVVTYDYDT